MVRLTSTTLAFVLGLAAFFVANVHANEFPTRPVRIIVGFGPGAANDTTARLIAPHMSQFLSQPVIVENRPGGASSVAAAAVARSEKDGYTLFMCTSTNVTNAVLGRSPGLDFFKDLAPITVTSRLPLLLVAHPSLGVSDVKGLIALSKSRSEPLFFGSSGTGSTMHLTGELFSLKTGSKLVHVPYQSTAAAMTDLIAGRLQLMFSPAPTAIPQVEAGTIKAIATVAEERSGALPDLTTIAEMGFSGFGNGLWDGVMAPAGTPRTVVDLLSRAINIGLEAPATHAHFKRHGSDPGGGSPEDFARLIESETAKWKTVADAVNLQK